MSAENHASDRAPLSNAVIAGFSATVRLSKSEAFEICEACALAEKELVRAGAAPVASLIAKTFQLVESRMTLQRG